MVGCVKCGRDFMAVMLRILLFVRCSGSCGGHFVFGFKDFMSVVNDLCGCGGWCGCMMSNVSPPE